MNGPRYRPEPAGLGGGVGKDAPTLSPARVFDVMNDLWVRLGTTRARPSRYLPVAIADAMSIAPGVRSPDVPVKSDQAGAADAR